MKSKATSGPWKYVKSTSYHSIVAENNGPCDIARIVNSNREANAHLIAAAPEMLEALLAARNSLVLNGLAHASRETLDKINAAIAKANGET